MYDSYTEMLVWGLFYGCCNNNGQGVCNYLHELHMSVVSDTMKTKPVIIKLNVSNMVLKGHKSFLKAMKHIQCPFSEFKALYISI